MQFSVFTNHVIKTKNRKHSLNKVKKQVSAVVHSRVISRSVSTKSVELCIGTPCLSPSEGHKHGGRKVTETPSSASTV